MKKYIAIALLPLALASCAVSPQDLTAKSDAVVANAQTEIGMACWLLATADVAYQVFRAPKASADELEDVRRAVAGYQALCKSPPKDTKELVAAIVATYRSVQAKAGT